MKISLRKSIFNFPPHITLWVIKFDEILYFSRHAVSDKIFLLICRSTESIFLVSLNDAFLV